jgi:hypothetical protein
MECSTHIVSIEASETVHKLKLFNDEFSAAEETSMRSLMEDDFER